MKAKITILIFSLTLFLITLYSYSQIDLNLTLSSWPPYQIAQNKMIYLGYFNRPLSTYVFLGLTILIFLIYLFLLRLILKNSFQWKNLTVLILLSCFIFLFSYPAFSHDIFNYIFDARVILKYHQNPYETRPLDFQNDLWTRFMHWTHRPSVFPPGWIFLSLLPYLLGGGKFVLTLLNFKIFIATFYLLSIIVFKKILKVSKDHLASFKLIFFALNPLVMIESLLSVHMDVVMIFFALAGFYALLKKRYWLSFFLILASGSIKYITLYLLPVLFIVIVLEKHKKRISNSAIINLATLFSTITSVLFIFYYGLNPWYFLWVFPFLVLYLKNTSVLFSLAILSFFLVLHYAPFLFYGFWTEPTSIIRTYLTLLGVFIFLCTHLKTLNLKQC